MINNRIQIKHDTDEHWSKAVNFIPLAGELVIYDGVLENNKYIIFPRFKIGDGKTLLKDLPFMSFGVEKEKSSEILEDGTLKI